VERWIRVVAVVERPLVSSVCIAQRVASAPSVGVTLLHGFLELFRKKRSIVKAEKIIR
jgi:hypothetical protein